LSRGAVYVPPCGAYAKRPLIDPDDWGSLGWPQVGEFGWPPGNLHPVILGSGKPLFTNIKSRLDLNQMNSKLFESGTIGLSFHPNT
jgi:hypothetical protein